MPYAVLHRQFLNNGPDELRIHLQHDAYLHSSIEVGFLMEMVEKPQLYV